MPPDVAWDWQARHPSGLVLVPPGVIFRRLGRFTRSLAGSHVLTLSYHGGRASCPGRSDEPRSGDPVASDNRKGATLHAWKGASRRIDGVWTSWRRLAPSDRLRKPGYRMHVVDLATSKARTVAGRRVTRRWFPTPDVISSSDYGRARHSPRQTRPWPGVHRAVFDCGCAVL